MKAHTTMTYQILHTHCLVHSSRPSCLALLVLSPVMDHLSDSEKSTGEFPSYLHCPWDLVNILGFDAGLQGRYGGSQARKESTSVAEAP